MVEKKMPEVQADTPKGDPFRRNYGELTAQQKLDMKSTKMVYENVWVILERLEVKYGKTRDLSLARTQIQDSAMWAVRAITKTEGQE